jgi:alpha-tubulin suppressor-like RCC1 family protein
MRSYRLLVILVVGLSACTFTQSFDALTNAECASGRCYVANGVPACGAGGACVVASCEVGFDDCNLDAKDGCESVLATSATDCGQCGNTCSRPNAASSCSNGQCVRAACNEGFADCNHDDADGCEVDLRSSADNCGACGTTCRVCENSRCVGVTAIRSSEASSTTCAVLENGTVYCWGDATANQTGSGATCSQSSCTQPTPARVANLEGVSNVAVGADHACATKKDGTVWCWGGNGTGQLGLGIPLPDSTPHATPARVPDVSDVDTVFASDGFTVAHTTHNSLFVWGNSARGQLALGTKTPQPRPQSLSSPLDIATAGLGGQHQCAATSSGALFCTGNNESFALGLPQSQTTSQCGEFSGLMQCSYAFVPLPQEPSVVGIAAGTNHTCVLRQPSQVACAGSNEKGQIGANAPTGVGQVVKSFTGVFVPAGFGEMAKVTAGARHTCSLGRDGHAWCWGNNADGQLGNPSGSTSAKPVAVVDARATVLSDLVDITAGQNHTCVLDKAHRVYCFGASDKGQLGPNAKDSTSVPFEVVVP